MSSKAMTFFQSAIDEYGLLSRAHADQEVEKYNDEVQGNEVICLVNLVTTKE